MTKKPLTSTQFLPEEILQAEREFDFLYDGEIEEPREYLERKRKRDMQKLIHHIIENDLPKEAEDIFRRVFFQGEKMEQVAKSKEMSLSNAYRYYKSAMKKIEDKLKYVIFYQNLCCEYKMMPLEKMLCNSLSINKKVAVPAVSMRVARLMEKENVKKDFLCKAIGLSKDKFEKVLKGKEQLNAEEIILLSGFFSVTADYILKGDFT